MSDRPPDLLLWALWGLASWAVLGVLALACWALAGLL